MASVEVETLRNATQRTNNNFEPTKDEMKRLNDAIRNPEFRRLLCEFAREQNDPKVRDRYEAETIEYDRSVGLKTTFLHPTPGFVIKTTNLRTDEKTFINVSSDPNIDPTLPTDSSRSSSSEENGVGGRLYAIPYSLTKQRAKDTDKGGRPCSVYDCTFHPGVVDMAIQGNRAVKEMLAQTAIDGVEALERNKDHHSYGDVDRVKLDRETVKYPRIKFKGKLEPSVMKEKLEREPKYKMIYRHKSTGSISNYTSECHGRPVEIQVEVSLPEFHNAKTVDLDVTDDKLELVSKEPVAYKLLLAFPFPVNSDNGCAKFNKQNKRLTVTVPVKLAGVRRLISTDSGYGGENDQSFSDDGVEEHGVDCESVQSAPAAAAISTEDQDDPEDLMFPPYSCKIYEDLMVLTLDVKNVAEKTLETMSMADFDEPCGFCLKFTSIGRGFVPFRYGFYCAFVLPEGVTLERERQKTHPEVEVWDNNMIVKVELPRGAECRQYRVGSSPKDLTIYELPQMHRRAMWKRQKDDSEESNAKDEDCDGGAMKERHSSGESEDSALSSSPISEDTSSMTEVAVAQAVEDEKGEGDAVPLLVISEEPPAKVKSILKPVAGIAPRGQRRCFSESQVSDTLVGTSQSSTSSCLSADISEAEGNDSAGVSLSSNSHGSRKKSVRFNEVVQRQVFRPQASILGQRHKNAKKNEQKRRKAQQRRASESDAVEEIRKAETKQDGSDNEGERESSPEGEGGSGSLVNSTFAAAAKSGKGKKRRQNRKQQLSEPTLDLMFKLDI